MLRLSGDPFVPEDAVRLQTIAWCVLAVQLLHPAFGMLAATLNAAGSNVEWAFPGVTGWVAVVLPQDRQGSRHPVRDR